MSGRDGPQSVKSIRRAAVLLEALGHYRKLGVRELARLTEEDKSAVYRALISLEMAGFVCRTTSGKYVLSQKLFELGNRYLVNMELKESTREYLVDLNYRTGETTLLGVLLQESVVYVEKLPRRYNNLNWETEIASEAGYRVPIYCSALGKAILAFTTESQREHLLKAVQPKRLTEHTITDKAHLCQDLSLARERGYAVSNEELRIGIVGIGAPLRDATGNVVAAISVTVPKERFSPEYCADLGALVAAYAARMSRAMGYRQATLDGAG